LDQFEQDMIKNYDRKNRVLYLLALDKIESEVLESKAAKLATADCYTLRNNIEFIRNTLERQDLTHP
jgi:hypothetical protein